MWYDGDCHAFLFFFFPLGEGGGKGLAIVHLIVLNLSCRVNSKFSIYFLSLLWPLQMGGKLFLVETLSVELERCFICSC